MNDPRLLDQNLLDSLSQVVNQTPAGMQSSPQQGQGQDSTLLQQIANPPEAPSFLDYLGRMATSMIPIAGPILMKQRQDDEQKQHLQALKTSVADLPREHQQVIAGLVQQGQIPQAFKAYEELAISGAKGVQKNLLKGQQNVALQAALGARLDRISDPVLKQSLMALMQTDPKSALIQVGNYENAQISQGFRGRSEDRAVVGQQQDLLNNSLKQIQDNPTAKRALDLQTALIASKILPDEVRSLSSSAFAGRLRQAGYKIDPKEASNVKLQLQNHLSSLEQGGILGIGAAIPEKVAKDPEQLWSQSAKLFASDEALGEQAKAEETRNHLKGQLKQLGSLGKPQPKRVSLTPEQAKAELKRRQAKQPKRR